MQDTRRLHPSSRCLVLHAQAPIPTPTGAQYQHCHHATTQQV